MKKCALVLIYGLLIVTFITSCLGDSNDVLTISDQPAVIMRSGTTITAQLKDSVIISSTNLSGDDGDCLLLKYKLDYGAGTNADSGRQAGYYTVDILAQSPVTLFQPNSGVDTISPIKDNERLIHTLQGRSALIRNRLFLFTEHTVDSFQLDNLYNLEYSGHGEPSPDTLYGMHKDRVYHVYLRTYKNRDATEEQRATPDRVYVNAFDMANLTATEKTRGEDSLFLKIKYVNSFSTTNGVNIAVSTWKETAFSFPLYPGRK